MEKTKHNSTELKYAQDKDNNTNKILVATQNDIETKQTSIKIIYNKLLKIIYTNTFYFECAECQCLLFTSQEISGICCLDQTKFCLIIDPFLVKKDLKIQIEKEKIVKHKDDELGQSDCIYYNAICERCSCVLGRYIIGVPKEKEKLKGKILVLSNKIDAVLLGEYDSFYVNLNDYLEIEQKENEEIKQFSELNKKLSRCIDEIADRMTTVGNYKEIKGFIEESEAFADTLERLGKYVNYLNETQKKSLN